MINYSIIIPHYNLSKYCLKLINTIPERKDIEIIVIDDKSLKNEFEYLKKNIKKKNVTLSSNNLNKKGAGTSRNIGINLARGKWIIFSDADDYFLEDAFKTLDLYKESPYDIIYFKTTSIFEKSKKKADRHIEFNKTLDKFKKDKENTLLPNSPCSKLIKRDLIIKHNIKFEEVLAANDALFSLKSNYYAKNIKICDQIIYCITKKENSITTNNSIEYFHSRFNENIKMDRFLISKKKYNLRRSFLKQLLKSRYYGFQETIKTIKIIKKLHLKLISRDITYFFHPLFIGQYLKRKIMEKLIN